MKGLTVRLKRIRTHLNLTQSQMADAVGVKYRSWQDYETGKSIPGGKVLAGIAKLGINTHWVLTGDGQILAGARPAVSCGEGVMQTIADTFWDELQNISPDIPPAERRAIARAFTALYARLSPKPDEHPLHALLEKLQMESPSE